MLARSRIPEPLARAQIRPAQILILFFAIVAATSIFAYKLTVSVAPEFRQAALELVAHASAAVLIALITLIVPELRRSIPSLYSRGREALTAVDALLFLAVMLTWAYGAHRFLVLYPLLRWNPQWFSLAGYVEHVPSVSPIYWLLWLLAAGVIGPFAEELLFRGYLLNLWQRRYGMWPAVVLSSLAFGAIHLQSAVYAFLSGVFLSLVYLRFRTLWPGTLLHGLYNIIATPIWFGFLILVKDRSRIAELSTWIPEISLTVAFFPLAFLFLRRFRPAS